jgi:tetratricopeptide (TPR) repeat protein
VPGANSQRPWARRSGTSFHTANVLLLFHVIKKATGQQILAAFVAGLFAVHPIHAESVAWVSGRKDVLWHDTLTLLNHTAKVTVDNSFLRLSLGDGLLREGRRTDALEQYRQAVTVAPADGEMHCKLAEALFRFGQADEARHEFQIALALDGDRARARYEQTRSCGDPEPDHCSMCGREFCAIRASKRIHDADAH